MILQYDESLTQKQSHIFPKTVPLNVQYLPYLNCLTHCIFLFFQFHQKSTYFTRNQFHQKSISPEINFTFAQSREQFWPANMLMSFESKANMNGNEKYKWKYIEVTYSLKLLQVIILHDFSK